MPVGLAKRLLAASLLAWGAASLAAIEQSAARPQSWAVAREASRPAWRDIPGRALDYRVTVRFRPILFWIGRENVGELRVKWVSGPGPGEEGIEFLAGLDPRRAPRQMNRWGYLREIDTPSGTRVFGVMTQSDERTLEELERTTGRSHEGLQVFQVTYGALEGERARAGVQKVALSAHLTYHDLDAVLSQLPGPAMPRTLEVPAGTAPGFCLAITSLLHENVEAWRRSGVASPGAGRAYLHAARLFTMTTRSSKALGRVTVGGREYRNVLESDFESRRVGRTGSGHYRIVYGTEGLLRDVPIRIIYRRNWWTEIEAVLASGG